MWNPASAGFSVIKGYADIAAAVRRHAHQRVIRSDNRELFGRMVFNILVSNDDDLRNHGFVLDPRLGGRLMDTLAPALRALPEVASAGLLASLQRAGLAI